MGWVLQSEDHRVSNDGVGSAESEDHGVSNDGVGSTESEDHGVSNDGVGSTERGPRSEDPPASASATSRVHGTPWRKRDTIEIQSRYNRDTREIHARCTRDAREIGERVGTPT